MKIEQLIETSDSNPTALYRGMSLRTPVPPDTVIDVPLRNDRKPLTSSPLAAMLFDYGMERAFGVKNIRRRALFCSTDIIQAKDYADAAKTGAGVVVQLMLEPSTPVIYNPQVDDSYSVMSGQLVWKPAECIRDLMVKYKHLEVEFNSLQSLLTVARNNFHVNDYLKYDPLDLWTHEVEQIVGTNGDKTDVTNAINVFTRCADTMVNGYQQTPYSGFPGGKFIETIVYDVQSVKGKVL